MSYKMILHQWEAAIYAVLDSIYQIWYIRLIYEAKIDFFHLILINDVRFLKSGNELMCSLHQVGAGLTLDSRSVSLLEKTFQIYAYVRKITFRSITHSIADISLSNRTWNSFV